MEQVQRLIRGGVFFVLFWQRSGLFYVFFCCCFLSLSFSCFLSFVLPMNFCFVFVVVVWVYTLSTFALT